MLISSFRLLIITLSFLFIFPLFSGEIINHINFVGRWSFNDDMPTASWPGSEVSAYFKGSEVNFSINHKAKSDSQPIYWIVIVDDGAPLRIKGKIGKAKYHITSSLDKDSIHFIKIIRDSEGMFCHTEFLGFDFGKDGYLLPYKVTPQVLSIEAIGDSITAGYGNLSDSPDCAGETLFASNYMSYSSIASRRLNAQLTTIAYSGQGIYRNYRGDIDSNLTPTIPRYYQHTLTPINLPVDLFNDFFDFSLNKAPDIVVINIGTNDFAVGIPTLDQFKFPYINLLREIRSNYPKAHIFLTCGQMLRDENNNTYGPKLSTIRNYLNEIIIEMNDSQLHTFNIEPMNPSIGYGCAYHPRSIDNNRIADTFISALKKVMNVNALDKDPKPL